MSVVFSDAVVRLNRLPSYVVDMMVNQKEYFTSTLSDTEYVAQQPNQLKVIESDVKNDLSESYPSAAVLEHTSPIESSPLKRKKSMHGRRKSELITELTEPKSASLVERSESFMSVCDKSTHISPEVSEPFCSPLIELSEECLPVSDLSADLPELRLPDSHTTGNKSKRGRPKSGPSSRRKAKRGAHKCHPLTNVSESSLCISGQSTDLSNTHVPKSVSMSISEDCQPMCNPDLHITDLPKTLKHKSEPSKSTSISMEANMCPSQVYQPLLSKSDPNTKLSQHCLPVPDLLISKKSKKVRPRSASTTSKIAEHCVPSSNPPSELSQSHLTKFDPPEFDLSNDPDESNLPEGDPPTCVHPELTDMLATTRLKGELISSCT